ncbi:MAG: LLM class flavin-dependent oxidoreductase [Candidatus Binataceae bacterium]|nr:LLM class flavin-dependent oxidoreductase [Candidatus Binataceae bacterium]
MADKASVASQPEMRRRNPTLFNRNRLKLGVFASNCSSGQAATKVPERWVASWDNNVKLAKMADAAGIECLVPVGRWKGYGGETDFEGDTFETITWACGLLAHTTNITVFGTVHCPLIHPVLAAKQIVTADHAGHGRFGLNIVCGWNQDEFNMFGAAQQAHDRRYDYGAEWWEIIKRIWSGAGPFDHDGEFFKLRGVVGSPAPWGGERPAMMNAGSSPAGRNFAAKYSDLHFDQTFFLEKAAAQVNETRTAARRYGRELQVFTNGYVVCRPTQKEAEDYFHHFGVENADWGAIDRLLELSLGATGSRAISPEVVKMAKERFAGGYGGVPFVGDPDHIAAQFKQMTEYGFDGLTFGFVSYLEELPYFVQEVIPRLERMGLREPAK